MAPYIEERVVSVPRSPVGPFPVPGDVQSVSGSVYVTPQLLVQQVAYALSTSIFSYSSPSIDLDSAITEWVKSGRGGAPNTYQLDTRVGAASAILGYLTNRPYQQGAAVSSVLASTGVLEYMKPALAQLAHRAISGLVLHVAAVDYDAASGRLVSNLLPTLQTSRDLGLALVASQSVDDAQSTAFLAAALSTVVPTLHVYDGVHGISQTSKTTSSIVAAPQLSDKFQDAVKSVLSLTASPSTKIHHVFDAANKALGTAFKPFEYIGPANAATVIVSFGSVESALVAELVESLPASHRVGAINVRLYSPFLEAEFLAALPSSVSKVVVLGQVESEAVVEDPRVSSLLYSDVSTSVLMKYGFGAGSTPQIVDCKYAVGSLLSQRSVADLLAIGNFTNKSAAKEVVFWDLDSAESAHTPARLAHTLSLDPFSPITFGATYDNEALGGVVRSDIRISPSAITPYPIDSADVVFVNESKIFKQFDVFATARMNAKVLIASKAGAEELEKILPDSAKHTISKKALEVFTVDYESIGENPETRGRTQTMVQQIAFWKVAFPEITLNEITSKIVLANGVDTELVAATVVNLIEKVIEQALVSTAIPEDWAKVADEAEDLPSSVFPSSFSASEGASTEDTTVPSSLSLVSATKKIVFSEAYDASNELRPDLPVKNFVAKVQVNERVTPDDYDRYIFHIELDITGTGLKYDLGEALGVHAPNNEELVREFIEWYGLDADALVTVPARDADDYEETKTVYQVLRHNLDLFGKPPKKFYESLAVYATDDKDKAALEKLGSAEGAAELKKRTEENFDSFVDILEEFKSARPTAEQLVEIIPALKRREYSIASSQKVHPNAVHLLIVVVDWIDPRGRKRFGQCSKYLADLAAGAEVVVSVKPSVMKLPAATTAPIIMSGLGTGLAPFKAFLEEKAWQKAQGYEIGDIYLFLGSRHQRQEYLYGELFEAYKNAGILTYIGAAFSRDQPQKIYIQDRINEAKPLLIDAFVKKTGTFYLCGPTWPVPDISAALADIVATDAASRGEKIDAARAIEELKEAGRYILEVY